MGTCISRLCGKCCCRDPAMANNKKPQGSDPNTNIYSDSHREFELLIKPKPDPNSLNELMYDEPVRNSEEPPNAKPPSAIVNIKDNKKKPPVKKDEIKHSSKELKNGSILEGPFKNEKVPHGKCTITNRETKVVETVQFADGVKNGPFEEVNEDGERYQGSYTDGKLDGRVVWTWADGKTVYHLEYNNGAQIKCEKKK